MAFVVSLLAYAPPPRADGIPFTKAKIEESTTGKGEWSLIDTLTLVPVDADPEHPAVRDLTTSKGTLAQGWYRVVWVDGAGSMSSATAPVQNTSELGGGTRPTVPDVAALVRARTKIKGGGEMGTFTATTRPTAEQVDELIDDAMDDVFGKIQPVTEPGSEYERRARGAVKLYAAHLIELSYFPESVNSGKSPADNFLKLYESRIRALIAEGETGRVQGEGTGGPGGGDSPGDAAWAFPLDGGGQIGLSTRW